MYQGNLQAAASILETAIAADDANRAFDSAAMKRLTLSWLRIDQGRAGEGIALADRFLLDPLTYQQRPVELALKNLRPR